MINGINHVIISLLISLLLLFVIFSLGSRLIYSRNKNRAFECGFDPKDSARLPFSMRFFLLAVVFLIFDIEIALLFPVVLGIKIRVFNFSYMSGFCFLCILLIGLVHEWREGSLNWVG